MQLPYYRARDNDVKMNNLPDRNVRRSHMTYRGPKQQSHKHKRERQFGIGSIHLKFWFSMIYQFVDAFLNKALKF